MAGPLEGIRIIDLSQVVAGPVCTMLLAEQGAEVIKVEFPDQGDILRHNRHFAKNDVNSLTLNCNRGKKSVAVDFQSEQVADSVGVLGTVQTTDRGWSAGIGAGGKRPWMISGQRAVIRP